MRNSRQRQFRDKTAYVGGQENQTIKEHNSRQSWFHDKTAYVGGQDFRPKLRFSCSVATALQRFVHTCEIIWNRKICFSFFFMSFTVLRRSKHANADSLQHMISTDPLFSYLWTKLPRQSKEGSNLDNVHVYLWGDVPEEQTFSYYMGLNNSFWSWANFARGTERMSPCLRFKSFPSYN